MRRIDGYYYQLASSTYAFAPVSQNLVVDVVDVVESIAIGSTDSLAECLQKGSKGGTMVLKFSLHLSYTLNNRGF